MADQDLTEFQSPDDIEKAEELSRQGHRPPSEVPGYDIQEMIGSGAYGEVWGGIDRNTGRKVAIKFYSRRSTVDFSLLSREVEKLASLAADRYVVQLLDVGWDAAPPFYVMDYIENGSLEDELQRRGPFSVDEATEMFQEVAIGLMHLHNKGILHCDLKPGNVLLDSDHKPRLADFGQSRLSSEQLPSLGTLFYMAPEQANLKAVPDAKWDVYALGALMFCMLTGMPPYRSPEIVGELESASGIGERLKRYQKTLKNSPPAKEHREIPGMDRQLAEIVERCIAADPSQRFENVQGILLALRQREELRARRPLLLLGMIGPFVLLCIMAIFGFALYSRSINKAENSLMKKAGESNDWAAQFASETAADEIDNFFESVHRLARDKAFLQTFKNVLADPDLTTLRRKLADPNATDTNRDLIKKFLNDPIRKKLQPHLSSRLNESTFIEASWFCSDSAGTQMAFVSEGSNLSTIGRNYAWRTYFHGGPEDLTEERNGKAFHPVSDEISERTYIKKSHLSAIFISEASQQWKVAFSVPIFDGDKFIGIVAATAHCGGFVSFEEQMEIVGEGTDEEREVMLQYAMLVDFREGPNQGAILGHPYFSRFTAKGEKLPIELQKKRLDEQTIQRFQAMIEESESNRKSDQAEVKQRIGSLDDRMFSDPLAPYDEHFTGQWLAGIKPIRRTIFDDGKNDKESTELVVLALEKTMSIMRPVEDLGRQILVLGVASVLLIIVVGVGFWFLAIRSAKESRERVNRVFRSATEIATIAKGGSTRV